MYKSHFLILLVIYSFPCFLYSQNGFNGIGTKKYDHVYAVIVGIADYSEIKDLTYADQDAKLVYDLLAMRFPDSKENFKLLTNENAHQGNIKKHIYNSCKQATANDLVILYFSGHGDVMSVYGTDYGYFLAYDASKSREYESGGAIEFEFINRHVNGAASTKKCDVWLITDACRAGKVINETGAKATMNTLNQSFLQTTKFVSCQANELSYEDSTLNQGVFTYFFLKALSGEANSDEDNGSITIDELNNYLRTSVRKHTTGKQTPKASSSDEFKPFFAPLPQLANLIKTSTGDPMNDMASRGKGIDEPKVNSSIAAISKAILDNDLRETNQSAYHLYKQKEKELALQDLENIKEDLAVAFLQRAQRILTKYLSGKPLIGDEKFSEAALDLEKALELLGPTHYLSEELSEKKTFLRCLEIIQTEQFNDYAHIERKLLDLEKANPVAAYINIGLSQLYHKMGKVDQAHEHTKKAHQKVTTWVKPQNVSAQIWLENGHIGQAQALIDQAEAQEMADGSTSLLQAKIKTNQLEMQLAIEQLEKIKSKNLEVSSTEIALLEGTIEAKRGRVKLAETIYKKALVSTPNNLELLSQLADLYREDGDTSSAIRYYDKIVKIKPSHSQAKIYLSSLKGEVTNPLLENYYDTKASLRIVDLYLAKKDYDKSITLLKEAQKFNAYDPAIDYAMAKVFYEKRDMAGAEKYLKIALGKSPYHFESIQSLANIYVLQKKFDETKALLNSSASYFKYSSKWKVFTYETYLKMEKKNNQLFILEEALKLDSTDTEAYKSLYRFHMEEGRYNAAEKEYKQMKRLGSGLKDSSAFIDELIFSVEKRVIMGLKDNRTVEGLKVILKYDRYYLSRMFGLAEEQYMQQNYRDGDINLERFGRYLFCMGKEDKMSYLALKAKMMLEVGMYQQALDLFRQLNEQSYQASYLGVAMAQYELGLKEDTWMANFSRDQNTKGFNSVAIERYRKMSKNKGYYPSGYK